MQGILEFTYGESYPHCDGADSISLPGGNITIPLQKSNGTLATRSCWNLTQPKSGDYALVLSIDELDFSNYTATVSMHFTGN